MSITRRVTTAMATLAALAAGALLTGACAYAAPEEPLTQAATGVTATGATLHGEINPKASATAGYEFMYNTNGACTAGATTEPRPEATGKGIAAEQALTGLQPNLEYTFCAVATHLEGGNLETTLGAPLSFKTLAAPPAVEALGASGITPFAARLEAVVNPNNQATTCKFEYGTAATPPYGTEGACEPATLGGFGGRGVALTLGSLTSGTTYHYRILLENAGSEKSEQSGEFTTLVAAAPVIDGESYSALHSTSITLEAQINPNYQETTYRFQYATDAAFTQNAGEVAGAEPLAAGFGDQLAHVALTNLTPRTTYYYRAIAKNATGTTTGPSAPPQSFITPATPLVSTGPAEAQSITRTGATVTGTVTPAGEPTTYHFVFVDAAHYQPGANECPQGVACAYAEGRVTPSLAAGGEHSAVPVQAQLNELRPGVTYHYALVATNSLGTTIGSDETLTTAPPTPPAAETGPASGVGLQSATIAGGVDTRGLVTTIQFELGSTPHSGVTTPATITGGSGSTVTVDASFNGTLQPGTTYYYRVIATNSDGTTFGAERSFTTSTLPFTPAFAPVATIVWPPEVAAQIAAAGRPPSGGGTILAKAVSSPPLTRKQRLAKALKTCARKPKSKRAACRRAAKKRYG